MNISALGKFKIGLWLVLMVMLSSCTFAAPTYVSPVAESAAAQEKPSQDIGTRQSDILKGTGRFSMYLLSKANIIANTDFVSIGIKRAKRGTDYTLDLNTGSLQFNTVIKEGEAIRVDYRYKGDGSPVRNVVDPAAMGLKFGSDKSNLTLNFGYRTADAKAGAAAADILTYGVNTNLSLSSTSKLTGMVYSATPETPNRMNFSTDQKNAPRQGSKTQAKKGNLLVQNLESKLGSVGFNATYEKVDDTFQGFQTMRESGKVDQNVINKLEKQKGTERLGFSASVPTGKGAGLSFSSDSLSDDKGAITTQALSYANTKLQMNLKTIDNSKDFTHYSDEQQRKESGIKRTYADMKLSDKFGSLSFYSNKIEDNRSAASSGIDSKGLTFQTSTISLNMSSRNIDKNFVRGNDLAEPERALLASERGIKRDNLSLTMKTSKASTLAFNSSSIKDNLHANSTGIDTRGFAFSTQGMNLSVNTRNIDKNFTRANDLGEADKAQIANEVGTKRTSLALNMRTGSKMDKSPAWSSMTESKIDAGDSQYTRRNMDATFGKLRFQVSMQNMDENFNKIAALNWNDRVEIAVAAKRQFDHNATTAQVTKDDIAKTYSETGLNRNNYTMQWDDKKYALTASMSSIKTTDVSKGQLQRSAFTLNTPKYNLYYKRHEIDAEFNRLNSLQPIEIANFGNETGMNRTEYGATTKMFGGNVNYVSADIADSTRDSEIKRSSLDYSNNRLKFKANFLSVPVEFNRISDLSNPQADKDFLKSEYGFERRDYWANFQATSAINVDAYLYNSNSDSLRRDREQHKYLLTYAPAKGPKITALTDSYSDASRVSGNLYRYDRRKLTFEQSIKQLGLNVSAIQDVTTTVNGSNPGTEVKVDVLHLDRNIGKYTKLAYDSTDITTNTGSFDKTKKYSVESPITQNLGITGNIVTRDLPGELYDEENYTLGLKYALNSRLSMTFYSVTNSSLARGVNRSTQITASGLLAKRFGPLSDVTVNTSLNTSDTRAREVGRNNSTSMSAGFLGGTLKIDNSEVLNTQTGIYSPIRKTSFATADNPKSWYQLNYQTAEFRDSTGRLVSQENASANIKLDDKSSLTYSSYKGTQQANTPNNAVVILPIGGEKLRYSRILNSRQALFGDYSVDLNDATGYRARTIGAGTRGELNPNAKYELYYGVASLAENGRSSTESVYRISLDCKINSDQFMVFSAQKKSDLEKSSINPDEGKTMFKIDYRSVFN